MTQTKKWYQSKTIWFNLAAGVLMAVEASLPELIPFLPENMTIPLSYGVAIGNILLRYYTSRGISK